MAYEYEKERPQLFTDEGQRLFLKIRDWVKSSLEKPGAVQVDKVVANAGGGDSWSMLACLDRLVELGEIEPHCKDTQMSGKSVYVGPGDGKVR